MKRKNKINKAEKKQEDYRTATVCAVIANCNRDTKKRKKPFTPDDFMPKEKKVQTWQEQLTIVEMLNEALQGKDRRC